MNGTRHKPSQPQTTPRQILPILVPAQKGEQRDGIANFACIYERDSHGTLMRSGPPVRLLRNRDISPEAIDRVLTPSEKDLLTGILDLKKAREKRDPLLLERATEKLFPFSGVDKHRPPPALFKRFTENPRWGDVQVPRLASEAMAEARVVLWYSNILYPLVYTPAVYAPNLKTAIFVRAFIGLQTCPHCGTLFIPEQENAIYCIPAHGHAHRMARSRYKKELKKDKRRAQ